MASGNSDKPPGQHLRRGSSGQQRRRSLLQCSIAEEQVFEETEDVFRSYAFHRYQMEQDTNTEEAPVDPEITEISGQLNSTANEVGRRLAFIGDDINMRYDSEFQDMLKHLQPNMDNAYDYFRRIATNLFESGINWGRVIALLGFGYRMAIYVYQNGVRGFLSRIARFVAEFIMRHSIARWIAQQGGWVAALDLTNDYFKYFLAVVAVVVLGQYVVRRFFSP
ncbi:bcl-2 homologous antagonist/killer [Rhinatrema bivittatum]|uniref:bcl-2 homologous antagonist/killer n=1 Tax=Rhinatrema bivittatum TaxID=194408 RepID=UPI001126F6AE|nr:bcl-2 homologous antagonist/killer [Rhinatrema bivittatum]